MESIIMLPWFPPPPKPDFPLFWDLNSYKPFIFRFAINPYGLHSENCDLRGFTPMAGGVNLSPIRVAAAGRWGQAMPPPQAAASLIRIIHQGEIAPESSRLPSTVFAGSRRVGLDWIGLRACARISNPMPGFYSPFGPQGGYLMILG